MNALLKSALLAIGLGAAPLAACAAPTEPPSEASRPVESSSLAAVRVHADWCPTCKVLDPKVASVQSSGVWDGVSFVRIDYTRRDRSAVYAEADQLGIGDAVRAYFSGGIKTGLLLLIDVENQTVVDALNSKASEAEIAERILAAQGAL